MAKHYIKNIGISAITYANNISSGQTYEFFDDVTNTYGININTFANSFYIENGIGRDIYENNVEYYIDSTLTSIEEFKILWESLKSELTEDLPYSTDINFKFTDKYKIDNSYSIYEIDANFLSASTTISSLSGYTKIEVDSNFLSANTSYYTQSQSNNNFVSALTYNIFTGTTLPANYYNKTEIDNIITGVTVDLSNYYTSAQTDANFVSVLTYNTFTGITLPTNYYNKTEVNSNFVSALTFETFTGTTLPNTYYNKTEIDEILTGVTVDLTSYYTSAQTDANFVSALTFETFTGTTLPNTYLPYTLSEDTNFTTGILNKTESTISFNSATTIFSILPTSSVFYYYLDGRKYSSTGMTITLNIQPGFNENQLWYIFIDGSGNICASIIPWDISSKVCPIAVLYWAGQRYLLGEERHDAVRNLAWHEWAHFNLGTQYSSGLDATFSTNSLTISSGVLSDEDIILQLPASTKLLVSHIAPGNTAYTFAVENSTVSAYISGTTLLWDNNGVLTDVQDGYYVKNFIYGTNNTDTEVPCSLIVGHYSNSNINDARNAEYPSFPTYISTETRLLYTTIWKNSGGTPIYVESADFRTAKTAPNGILGKRPIYFDELEDVQATTPNIDDTLRFNGEIWITGPTTSVGINAGGNVYYYSTPTVIGTSTNNSNVVSTLETVLNNSGLTTVSANVTTNTVFMSAFIAQSAVGYTVLPSGQYNYQIYASVNSTNSGRLSTITIGTYKVNEITGITLTTTGTGTSRTVTATGGSPFTTSNIVDSSTNTLASYLQTPQGLYQITTRTNDTQVVVTTPTTYTNETSVTGCSIWYNLFNTKTGTITNLTTNYGTYSVNNYQPSYNILKTTKIGSILFGTSNNTTTITLAYDSINTTSYFIVPSEFYHNTLKGINGGDGTYYWHLTNTQYTTLTGSVDASSLHNHNSLYYTQTQANTNFLSANTSYYTQLQANTNFVSALTYNTFTGITLPTNYYNKTEVNDLLTGKTDLSLFNAHISEINPHGTSFSDLVVTAHTHKIIDITDYVGGLSKVEHDKNFVGSGNTIAPLELNTDITIDNKLTASILSATTVSAVTYYGDGSNLTGISVSGDYVSLSGGTMTGGLVTPSVSATTINGYTVYGSKLSNVKTTPLTSLHIIEESEVSTLRGILIGQHNNGGSASRLIGRKSQGTFETPTAISNTSGIFRFTASAHDGTNYVDDVARIEILANGTIGTGVIPTAINFRTSNASGVLVNAMTLTPLQTLNYESDVSSSYTTRSIPDVGYINTNFVNISGDIMTGTLILPTLSATTISATTFYGDGSNLTGISGSGDVVGPGSATDNAIVRFDGTTGKLIQNSTCTIDDNGNVLIVGNSSSIIGIGTVGTYAGTVELTQEGVTMRAKGTYEGYVKVSQSAISVLNAITYQTGTSTSFYGRQVPDVDWITTNVLQKSNNLSDVSNQQTSLNNLTAVSAATNEYVLTKDTGTGNAIWKASGGGVPTSRQIIANNTIGSVIGGGDLTVDRTLTLQGDSVSPGNSKYYGTNSVGTKGFYDLPTGGSSGGTSYTAGGGIVITGSTISIDLTNLTESNDATGDDFILYQHSGSPYEVEKSRISNLPSSISISYSLPEAINNTAVYFYSWNKSSTAASVVRSGNNAGIPYADACNPIEIKRNSVITLASLSLKGAGVQAGTPVYPVIYEAEVWAIGWDTEGTLRGTLQFSISSGFTIGAYSPGSTNYKGTITNANINIYEGDLLAVKFKNGNSASLVGQMLNAFISLQLKNL